MIDRAVPTLPDKLFKESTVCRSRGHHFLLDFRSAVVAISILPTAVLFSFAIMCRQDIDQTPYSLAGNAIAVLQVEWGETTCLGWALEMVS